MSEYSRRQFLHHSLLAAAATATAGPVGNLMAAELSAASVTEKGPNEKLRFAICGVNGQGNSHIGSLLGKENSKDADIVVICDVDKKVGNNRCDEIERKTGSRPRYVQNLQEVLDDKNIDCVSAAVPNHWHALRKRAMQAGKDVYIEKPACHNIFEGQQMVQAARNHNRICQVGTQSRSMPGTIDAIQFMRDGKIGEVNLARGICFKERMSIGAPGEYDVPDNIDYNLWRGPAPMAEKSPYRGKMVRGAVVPVHYDWHWNWLFGNGDLGNQGVHEMDVARWGLGVELPKGVITYGGRFGYVDAGLTPNTEVAVLDFGPKTLVFEMHGLTKAKFKPIKGVNIGIVFEGTDGYVAMTSYTNGKAFDKDGNVIKVFGAAGETGGASGAKKETAAVAADQPAGAVAPAERESIGAYYLHHANFIKAVRSRKSDDLHCDILEGARSADCCHLANISYRLGTPTATSDIMDRMKDVKMGDNAQDILDRTVDHLKENGVTLDDKTQFQCGQYLKFDPVAQNFPGDAAANALLTREYREGFVVPAGKDI